MHTESSEPRSAEDPRLERAIILQLLRADHEQRWSPAQLEAELGTAPAVVEAALRRLECDGVLSLSQGTVWASRAAWRLDELGLIGI
jgi:DNA-binding GntR family transcriptional regulator